MWLLVKKKKSRKYICLCRWCECVCVCVCVCVGERKFRKVAARNKFGGICVYGRVLEDKWQGKLPKR